MDRDYTELKQFNDMFNFFDEQHTVDIGFGTIERETNNWCQQRFGHRIWCDNYDYTNDWKVPVANKDGIWDSFAGYYFFKHKKDAMQFKLTWSNNQ